MSTRRSSAALAGVAAFLTLAFAFGTRLGYSAGGGTQGGERSAVIGVTGTAGLLIESVEPGSPAEQIGMQPGDVIVSLGGRPVQSMGDLRNALRNPLSASGAPVEVVFRRFRHSDNRIVEHRATVRRAVGNLEAPTPAPNGVVAGGVLNGKAIEKPAPPYPAEAKAARVSGIVTVSVVLDEEGRVETAEAVSGHPLLRAAAVEAAYRARFSPTKLSGQPVKVSGVVTYNFVLQ